jgi:hypothetical protein
MTGNVTSVLRESRDQRRADAWIARVVRAIDPDPSKEEACRTEIKNIINVFPYLEKTPSPYVMKKKLAQLAHLLKKAKPIMQDKTVHKIIRKGVPVFIAAPSAGFLDDLECIIKTAEFIGTRMVVQKNRAPPDERKVVAAFWACSLLAQYSVQKAPPPKLVHALASVLYEGITGHRGANLAHFCRKLVKPRERLDLKTIGDRLEATGYVIRINRK